MAGLQAIICGMINRRSLVAALAAISMLFWPARDAAAQSYPQRPVRLIVPAPAGGPTDVPGRLIADGLSGLFSQRFVVENRVGAGGLVAGEFVERSEPNGYTLLYVNTSEVEAVFALLRSRVRGGEVRALAITGANRDADLPDIPALAESGYPAVTSTSGTGIVAPAGVPREIVARLNSRLNELIERAETQG